mmetsp:Transcript_16873/g.28965  ORF Transcript_16873/g.28965 Transcript_16873/m.28965 type:complete len:557 (+) Transcript_16873:115-1785(+)|eukprot:CAMPEP_0203746322 /NCGR_PEP_ID=MMETSP0098-20131031/1806_1 /ASSEMBLY_ACC=CAM_ASM_000208 /TAXON_ID=96639 /ORGANISM=" , Strain NY0313808BC1" /LENGTH=556 /DNA_ID=CAMNT_0050634383 /DNA_START=65 /DNA_END=1735 /DNA_ORIENTATION=-
MGAGIWIFGSLALVGCSIWTFVQLRWFARRDTPLGYFLAVFFSWWMGVVAVVVMLPMDVTDAAGKGEEGVFSVSEYRILFWKLNYWLTFVWCWVVCPIVMEYWASGYFSPESRLKSAVRKNLKFYFYVVVALLVVVVFIAFKKKFNLPLVAGFLIASANVYGMFLVVVMLGYGIVECPRDAWNRSNAHRLLSWYYRSAPLLETRLFDAKSDLQEIVAAVGVFNCSDPSVIPHLEQVKETAEIAQRDCLSNYPLRRGGSIDETLDGTLDSLAELNYRLKRAVVKAQRAQYIWDDLLASTSRLEQEINNAGSGEESYQRLDGTTNDLESEIVTPREKSFLKKNRSLMWKVIAGCLACSSAILLWNECVSPVSSKVSIFAVMVHNAPNEFMCLMFTSLPLVYMAACAYTALFKFKLLDSLALHGNQQTDVYCLLANSGYMGRLQFSLGVNYVNMLLKDDVDNLAFSKLVGDMKNVPFLGTSFNYYIPLLIVALAACTFFNVLDRFLNKIGIETHTDPGVTFDTEWEQEMTTQGQQLVARSRPRSQGSSQSSNNTFSMRT